MEDILRTYQSDIFDLIIKEVERGEDRILIEMPVGSGKSTVIKRILQTLILSGYSGKISLVFPGSALKQYFNEIIISVVAGHSYKVQYRGKSISVHKDPQLTEKPAIYIVDDTYNSEVRSILKVENNIVIGFYSPSHQYAKQAFGKEKANYSLGYEELLGAKFGYQQDTSLLGKFKAILEKLNIDVASTKDLEQGMLKLELWVNDYLENNSPVLTPEKMEMLQIIIKRREALDMFSKLLTDSQFLEGLAGGQRIENIWQKFFEDNKWIFGLSLNLYFLSALNGKKLEQVVAGFDVNANGKRVDGLLKSKGFISSFHFCEIKTHMTEILLPKSYRSDSYSISPEFAGAVAQVQKTVSKAMATLRNRQALRDNEGFETDEVVYNYLPQATLVIGSLEQFSKAGRINEEKYSSFELFRKSLLNIQVITFDELYERAKAIVEVTEQEL